MSDGVTMVSVTLWPVSLVNSDASTLVAICTEPTLSTRISAAPAMPDDNSSAHPIISVVPAQRIASPGGQVSRGSVRVRKLFHDRIDEARIHRLDIGREGGGDVAVAPHQIFVKIPTRRIERTFGGRPFVEGMGTLALHLCFR